MRRILTILSMILFLGMISTPRWTQAAPSAGHYAGGAALVIYMFGGLDIFGLQAPKKKTQAPSILQEEFQALASPLSKDLARQKAAGSRDQASRLGPKERLLLGKDRSLGRQIGR